MAKVITLRLSEQAYQAVKQQAAADETSMNAWIELVLEQEDLRRRCRAHDAYLAAHPDAAAFALRWAERNQDNLLVR